MNKDLISINEEIDNLMMQKPSFSKYEKLGVLLVCKQYIENSLKTDKTTTSEVIEYKLEHIGARATLLKLTPILAKLIKDLELISPTISGEFIRQLKEM